jgi:hypothetical protein
MSFTYLVKFSSRRLPAHVEAKESEMAENDGGAGTAAPAHTKIIHYTVSAEPQITDQHKLTGREILERAGFTPAEDYRLARDPSDKEIHLDDEVPIHEGESFTATYRGITPTS